MEVTIWIERSLGLSVTKTLAQGSSVAALKHELLSEDLLGSISAEEIFLVPCGRPENGVLRDEQLLDESLAELEFTTPPEPSATEETTDPFAGLPDEQEPKEQEDDSWDRLYQEELEKRRHEAQERFQQSEQPRPEQIREDEAAREESQRREAEEAQRIEEERRQKEAADAEKMRIQAPPQWLCIAGSWTFSEWGSNQDPIKYVFEHEKGSPVFSGYQEGWTTIRDGHFMWDTGNAILWNIDRYIARGTVVSAGKRIENLEVKDEQGNVVGKWQGTRHEDAEKKRAQRQAELAAKQQKEEEERAAAAKRQEAEKKAAENKDNVRVTAAGAKKLLGTPLTYEVLTETPIYLEPMPQANQIESFEFQKGSKIYGYPGSVAWIRVDANETKNLPKAAAMVKEKWLPVRQPETASNAGGQRELVLQAIWPRLKAEEVLASSIEVSWPGVPQPVEPNMAQYTVEVRPNQGALLVASKEAAKATTVVTGSTKTKATVKGLVAEMEVQIRVIVNVVGPYSTDFRLMGPWQDFRTVSEEEEAKRNNGKAAAHAQADADAEASAPGEGEGSYEVVHTLVMLRGEPSRKGRPVGVIKKGAMVLGTPFKISGEPWIKLSPQVIPGTDDQAEREISAEESAWALIDATGIPGLGLGVLMTRVGEGGYDDPGEWKVIHDRVVVRARPSTAADAMGFHVKGVKVIGVSLLIHGKRWLRTESGGLPGVTGDLWMLIDGSSVGLGELLERIGNIAPKKRSKAMAPSSRPVPPKPLTPQWLAAHGGLPSPPSKAREENLDPEVDVGMASVCSMVWVKPGDGGPEVAYVAKRSPQQGSMDTLLREYRFYTEIARRGVKPGKPQPELLGGEMRIPQCLCANWGKQGQEHEAFLLLMERLDSPKWNHVDPEIGCSMEQAIVAVETLGRMHKAFSDPKVMEELDWLPYTLFDVRNAAGIQMYFSHVRPSAQPLVDMLPPGAQDTVEKMALGGLGETFVYLAQSPITLCHGDYRSENLRFSAPGEPPAVGVFDWGLVNKAKGVADYAYFVMLSMTPQERRAREEELFRRYLEARGDFKEKHMNEHLEDLKNASIAILGMVLMTRHGITGSAAMKQETRNMLVRMMRWIGEAITDWKSGEVLRELDY